MSTSTVTTRPVRTADRPTGRPAGSASGARSGAGTAGPRSGKPGAVRLTRRGRLVLTLLLLGLILGAFVLFGGQSVATDDAGDPVSTRTVVVSEGDTLWEIAAEVAEPGGIREAVHEIEQLNSLSGPVLTVGQEIAVPVG